MYLVLLTFADKGRAGELMAAHNAWIARGFDDGVFLMVGSLQPSRGGAVLAHGTSRAALQHRVDDDPFVAHGVVNAEILEIAPARTDARLAFLA
ncbi:MAG: hypothetical protein KC503_15225 [Myxococcales bacterium]|nr:hypothetical protein [Myxococcales bacterium]